jgi:hypothetical protein
MNKQRKLGWEIILMLVPVIALTGWGIWSVNQGPFKLVIQEVKVTPLPKDAFFRNAVTPGNKGIKVFAYIGYQGRAPAWWGVSVDSASRVHFTKRGVKDDHNANVGYYPATVFDKSRGQYIVFYEGELTKDLLKQATCHVSVRLRTQRVPSEQLAFAKASIPAHELH